MPKFTNGHAKAGGRRKGSPNKGTERARRLISEADDKAIVHRVVREAKDNTNPESARLYFRYLRPPSPRETYIGPIDYASPKTVDEARALILELGERLAKCEIPLELHDALVGGLRVYLGDRAAEQQKILDRLLEDAVRENEK